MMSFFDNKSLSINAALNLIRSCLSIIFPLLVYPYLFRTLGVSNIGEYSFAQSIVNYFLLIAALNFSSYAVREGALLRNDRERLDRFASEIFSINLASTLISYVLLGLLLLFFPKFSHYSILMLIISVSIVSSTIGVEWINTIFEDYVSITLRTIAIYSISLISVFVWVKGPEDLYKYAIIMALASLIVSCINYIYCKKYINLIPTTVMNLKVHMQPILYFFANKLAINIYVNADITMLGFISGDFYVGIYTAAVKIYYVIKHMIAAVYTVALPRLSVYVGYKDSNLFRNLYSKIISIISLMLLPIGMGIIVLSNEILTIIAGNKYLDGVFTLQILSLALIGAIYGGLLTVCFNIPFKYEKLNFYATFYSAIINIVLNLIFVPMWKQNGAAVTTVISEYFVLLYVLYILKDEILKYIDYTYVLKNLRDAILGCCSVWLIAIFVQYITDAVGTRIILVVFGSVFLYYFELVLLKNDLLNLLRLRHL